MRDKTREEILKELEEGIKAMVKKSLEGLMLKEREISLKQHPTKASGHYTRNLLTILKANREL